MDTRSPIRFAPLAGVALVALGASLWGVDGVLRQPLLDADPRDGQWSSWTIVFYEHLILTACVLPYLVLHRRALERLTPQGWLAALAIGWGASALATLAFTEALSHLESVTVVILLQKTQPLFALAAAAIVLRERPRVQVLGFLAPALAGTYLLAFGWTAPADVVGGAAARPAFLALLAAALWGGGTALGRRALEEVGFDVLTGLRFTLALPLLFVIAAWHSALGPPAGAPGADWVRLPLIALLPGLAAMLLYYRGLRTTPASVATFAELAFPATAVVVNYVFLDATVTGMQLVGFVVLWATIAQLNRLPVRLPPERAPAPAAIVAVES
jgi:drug/metabolite transporter (DMT)-like permease